MSISFHLLNFEILSVKQADATTSSIRPWYVNEGISQEANITSNKG